MELSQCRFAARSIKMVESIIASAILMVLLYQALMDHIGSKHDTVGQQVLDIREYILYFIALVHSTPSVP